MGVSDKLVFVKTIADAAPSGSWTLVGDDCTETARVDRRVPPNTCSMPAELMDQAVTALMLADKSVQVLPLQ
jgi:hypothetical protein